MNNQSKSDNGRFLSQFGREEHKIDDNIPFDDQVISTWLGYFNVTVEDETIWANDKVIRMCL
jgi:hypothetical protein